MQVKNGILPGEVAGLGYGILAYLIWGFFPVYFKALADVPPLQVVCHRIVWSVLFLWRGVREARQNGR